MENWKDVPGWEGWYQVSDEGQIRSVDRTFNKSNGVTMTQKGQIIVPFLTNKGYYNVHFYKNSKMYTHSIGRLVGFAFPEICGEYFEGAEIDHINTIRTDNRPENLRWVEPEMQYKNPTTAQHCKTANINNPSMSKWVIKLSADDEILHFYPSTRQAERETGVKYQAIGACCRGIRKTAGGFIWKYAE